MTEQDLNKLVESDTADVSGSVQITDMLQVTQAQYDGSVKDATTLYYIVG